MTAAILHQMNGARKTPPLAAHLAGSGRRARLTDAGPQEAAPDRLFLARGRRFIAITLPLDALRAVASDGDPGPLRVLYWRKFPVTQGGRT